MIMMDELTFFLWLQIKQAQDGTFVHQEKYTKDILKKFNMGEAKPFRRPCQPHDNSYLIDDEDDEPVDRKE
jgi:hypothetical protein